MSMIPVTLLESPIALEKLFSCPTTTITHDWNGEELPFAVRFILAKNATTLYFGAEVETTPHFDKRQTRGTFVEKLWELDVAELFIGAPGSERYQEFNLSPSGAWWTAVFKGERTPDTAPYKIPTATCYSKILPRVWRVALSVPLSEIGIPNALSGETTANVSFILGKPQRFLSWATINTTEPDFHKFKEYEAVELLPGGPE